MIEDLSRFRWHTGAPLSRVRADEPLPVLFRDVGLEATLSFLERGLERLAGPLSPLIYMRSAAYREPYVDHGAIGRLALLHPRGLRPWHAGVAHVLVAHADRRTAALVWVPPEIPLAEAAVRLAGAKDPGEAREALGAHRHDAMIADARHRLTALSAAHARVEHLAEPLRRRFQSSDAEVRRAARARLAALDLDEHDLTAAWHHLPEDRRRHLERVLA